MPELWIPQKGPQLKAIEADWCDELFFGGARGGGKSDFLLGDYVGDIGYGAAWRGILFRKTYLELEELQIRAKELYPAYGGQYKSAASADFPFANCWYFPGGATLKMRYLEHERDADGYQGHQYCVAVGTRILMADGSPKNIEDICAGDYVATLEGAKMVTATVKPYAAPCVQMIGDGVSQVHPVWHPVLTASGWQSYASVLGIDSTEFAKKFQATSQHSCVNLTVKRAVSVPWLGTECREPKSSQGACSKHVSSDVKRRGFLRLALRCIAGLLPVLLKPQRTLDCCPSCATCDVLRGAQNGLKQALGFLGRCFDGFRLNDEQPRGLSDSDQDVPPSLGGAASHNRASCRLDVLDNIPLHIRQHEHGYQHPYALSEVSTEWESSLAACKLSFVGERLVADITVQDANHYITHDQGTINKNTWIGFDELPNHATSKAYDKLKACLRNPHGIPGRIRASGNPGGKGHIWVKSRFIDIAPPYTPYDDPETGLTRMFIPSRIADNKYLREDKKYLSLIKSSGSAELVKAWLEGNWDVVAGAFFDCWERDKHVIKPFAIPDRWTRFRSFDWGSSRPFSVGWWAVADGETDLPRGALVRYREWYGCKPGVANEGLKLTAEAVAAGIVKRSNKETYSYSVADPACWKVDGGPSIAERMRLNKVLFRQADNKRINGWDQMRQRFVGIDDEPMIYTFNTCVDSIRTIPLLQHDGDNPEDIDSDMEDHCFAAGTMVETDRGLVAIELMPECGRVLSINGKYQAYRSARLVKRDSDLVRLTFDSGVKIYCTPDHKFLVDTDEWRYARDLSNMEVICSQSSLVERFKSLMVSGITCAVAIFNAKVYAFTSKCGSTTTAQFLMDIRSTIGTKTGQTTNHRTLSASPWRSTLETDTAKQAVSEHCAASAKRKPQPLHGTDQRMESSGTLAITPNTLSPSWMRACLPYVKSVALRIWSALAESSKGSIAATTARRARCVSVEKADKGDVYCLTVPTTATFAIEGGLLVSNCADEWRYACMSRPMLHQEKKRKPAPEVGSMEWVYANSREIKEVSKYRS